MIIGDEIRPNINNSDAVEGSMEDPQHERKGVIDILPLFAPAFYDLWQIILPRDGLVVYISERES